MRHGFLLPARVVMAGFRGKMVAAIRQTFVRGALALPAPMRPPQVLNLLNRLGHPRKTPWNVWIMERYRHGAGVVTYGDVAGLPTCWGYACRRCPAGR